MACLNSHQRGFSLVELVVVTLIIATVSMIALPSVSSMVGNAQIRTVGESFRNGLQLARAEAVKRNQQVRFRVSADSSWQVGCVTVVADADGDGVDECPAIIAQKSAREGSSAKIEVTRKGSDNVIYTSFGIQAGVAGQLEQLDINNTSVNAAQVRKVRVLFPPATGTIRMCEPAITAPTDPRKC